MKVFFFLFWLVSVLKVEHMRSYEFYLNHVYYASGTNKMYRQVSNIRRNLVGNKIVDHSDVVGASPVVTAPTTSSFPTEHLVSIDCAKTTTRQDEWQLSFVILILQIWHYCKASHYIDIIWAAWHLKSLVTQLLFNGLLKCIKATHHFSRDIWIMPSFQICCYVCAAC